MKLPRIYKKSKTGAIVICDISVDGDTITVTTGQLDGAMQHHPTICVPMNIGRSNETTAEEQAKKEAKAKHIKKIKSGYVLDPSGELTVKLPMKVKIYQDQKPNIIFPALLSPKLNGVNGEYLINKLENSLELFTRGGNLYPNLTHLESEIKEFMAILNESSLNGEIYKHGMHLQDITSAAKKPNQNTPDLEFHVFDTPASKLSYDKKLDDFNSIDNSKFTYVKMIRTYEVNSHDEIEKYMQKFLVDGYEGVIIRNKKLIYEYNVRSSDIFKYKIPKDGEFKVVGWRADKKGHPVFTCKIPEVDGAHEFNVKLKGTDKERLRVAENADSWIGQWLNIEFESYSKDKKPTKPVGIGLRDCDSKGNPVI